MKIIYSTLLELLRFTYKNTCIVIVWGKCGRSIICGSAQLGKEGSNKMSDLRQLTEGCEKRENLILHRKEYREVVLACNLPSISSVTLVFAVNLSLCVLTCNQYNIEFYIC